jgi:hypothetical protein
LIDEGTSAQAIRPNMEEQRTSGTGSAIADSLLFVGFSRLFLIAAFCLLPYSLALLPVAVFLIWYSWRPRKLQFSLAAMFWVSTFVIFYYAAFFILVLR